MSDEQDTALTEEPSPVAKTERKSAAKKAAKITNIEVRYIQKNDVLIMIIVSQQGEKEKRLGVGELGSGIGD